MPPLCPIGPVDLLPSGRLFDPPGADARRKAQGLGFHHRDHLDPGSETEPLHRALRHLGQDGDPQIAVQGNERSRRPVGEVGHATR